MKDFSARDLKDLKVEIFYDGSDEEGMLKAAVDPRVSGYTTNPSLMRKAGVEDYEEFAKNIALRVSGKPISFEVFSDEAEGMIAQAHKINSWGENVFVKIPVTNSKGESTFDVIKKLTSEGVNVNVTALFSIEQVEQIAPALSGDVDSIVSVFAGRVGETGRDPIPIMEKCKEIIAGNSKAKLLWAAAREVYDIFEANDAGADIITVSPKILGKAESIGVSLEEMSLRAVQQFYEDGSEAGYSL